MNLRRSVQATVKYAGFFNFPLVSEEIHFWLISPYRVPRKKINLFLPGDLTKAEQMARAALTKSSDEKINFAKNLAKKLKYIPGIKMMALTGSVAAKNSYPSDDIDLFFITSPHTLWLVRPLVLFVISIFYRRRHPGEDHSKAADAFCPNLWLDSISCTISENKRNLYTAHEILQIIPLLDRDGTYQSFLYRNRWVKNYLANAYYALTSKRKMNIFVNQFSPLVILLVPLNYLFYLIQLIYMWPKKSSESVSLHSAYLHTTDFASKIHNHLEA